MTGFRTLYDTDVISLGLDGTVPLNEGSSVTATNYEFLGGNSFSVQIPLALSAHGGLDIQLNNSNPMLQAFVSPNVYSTRMTQDEQSGIPVKNKSFSANWITVDTMSSGTVFRSLNNVTARWIRLKGLGLTGGLSAYVCVDSVVRPGY